MEDPKNPEINSSLNRPYFRKDTIDKIKENYIKLPNGDYIHKTIGETIKAPVDIGHVKGFEHRRLEAMAKELKMTQKEFNEYVNSRPDKFQLENRSDNRGHKYEMEGRNITDNILKDMKNFVKQLRGKK